MNDSLSVGNSYTYKQMCECLNEPYKGGTAKQAHIKQICLWYSLTKEGTKYTVLEKYQTPKPKEKRKTTSNFNRLFFKILVLSVQNPQTTFFGSNIKDCGDYYHFEITHTDLYNILGFTKHFHSQYDYPELSKLYENELYAKCSDKIRYALKSLASYHLLRYVLVYQLDRFARNRYDSANYKAKLKKNGVRVLSAKENISEDASGILIEGVLESMAEYYSAELSQKVKRGIRESYEKGYFIGGFGLFGYDIIDKHWVINETEAAVVREIFERYHYGEKAKSIVSWLDSTGVRNKSGKPFTVNALAKLIRNTKYKGIVEYDERILTNVTPAIVDEKTWDDCNRILDNQRHKQKCIQKHSEYILSGKLFCGNCGTLMTAEGGTSQTGRQYHYYKCFTRKRNKGQCKKNSVSKQYIEDLVFEKTVEYILSPDVIDTIARSVTDNFNQGLKKSNALILLEKELANVEQALNGFLSAIAAGIVTKSTKERMLSLEAQKEELENKIELEKQRNIPPLKYETVRAFLYYFANKEYKSDEEKNEFFNSFIYRVVLFDDYIYIFYNTSPEYPTKVKLEKEELQSLRDLRYPKAEKDAENKESTLFEPLKFKLGACGGEGEI